MKQDSKPSKANKKRTVKKSPKPQGATWQQIERWAKRICSIDGNDKVTPFLLLMSEIDRSQFDRVRVDSIVGTAMQAGFSESDYADKVCRETVKALRGRLAAEAAQ